MPASSEDAHIPVRGRPSRGFSGRSSALFRLALMLRCRRRALYLCYQQWASHRCLVNSRIDRCYQPATMDRFLSLQRVHSRAFALAPIGAGTALISRTRLKALENAITSKRAPEHLVMEEDIQDCRRHAFFGLHTLYHHRNPFHSLLKVISRSAGP